MEEAVHQAEVFDDSPEGRHETQPLRAPLEEAGARAGRTDHPAGRRRRLEDVELRSAAPKLVPDRESRDAGSDYGHTTWYGSSFGSRRAAGHDGPL
jgi:hypothetical protein